MIDSSIAVPEIEDEFEQNFCFDSLIPKRVEPPLTIEITGKEEEQKIEVVNTSTIEKAHVDEPMAEEQKVGAGSLSVDGPFIQV